MAKIRRSKIAQNIVNNTPASGWQLATKNQKRAAGVSLKQPYYVRVGTTRARKNIIIITRDEYTVKGFGMHRRKLAETRATEAGATHPVHGYRRPLTEKMRELLQRRRRLKLVRDARRAYERRGNALAASVATTQSKDLPEGRTRIVWPHFKEQLDRAIGPDTAAPVESRELGGPRTRIEDGNWHGMIDALKAQLGEGSPIVKLLRSSGRFVEGGVWVVD